MQKSNIVTTDTLQKGESCLFLGYTIFNCTNNDGLVLSYEGQEAKDYEYHLGNFGDGTKKENVDYAKKFALLHFMIKRPSDFASTICFRMSGSGGQSSEFFLLKGVLKREGLEMPKEITNYASSGNAQIGFNGHKLFNKLKS